MNINTKTAIALSVLLGAILLCRVGYQIYNRIDTFQRYQRIPSSASYPTLTFDVVVACFLIGLGLFLSY